MDVDKETKLNPLEFETLNELIGKNLKLIIELKKASDLPDKYAFKTMCKYNWQDSSYETKTVEKKKDPIYDYMSEHIQTITDDMIQFLMYNTLTVGVYGMIESKKKAKLTLNKDDYDEDTFKEVVKR